jgi:DNA-binding IclR family transcriptional regulator
MLRSKPNRPARAIQDMTEKSRTTADPAQEGRDHGASGTRVLGRAVDVMRVLATHGDAGAPLTTVARASQLHKATAHRILATLTNERLVERVPDSQRYRLGIEVFAFAAAMGERFDLKTQARPSLERLAAATGDTVYLGLRNGDNALCLDRCDGGDHERTLTLSVMDHWPLGVGAFSMALLAYLTDGEVADIIGRNDRRLAGQPMYTPARLREKVAETRLQRFAYNEVRVYPKMSAVAVPILDDNQRPIASLCVVAAIKRMGPTRRPGIAELLWQESQKLSRNYFRVRAGKLAMDSWRQIGFSFAAIAAQDAQQAALHGGVATIGHGRRPRADLVTTRRPAKKGRPREI